MPGPRIPRGLTRRNPKPNLHRRVHHLAFVRQLPLCSLRKSSAVRGRACADGNRWRCRHEARRSLRRSSVHRLPCETASDRRAQLLVCAPHRSCQCGFAAVDHIGRFKGRGAYCLSGATTNRSDEGLLRAAPAPPEQILTADIDEISRDQRPQRVHSNAGVAARLRFKNRAAGKRR